MENYEPLLKTPPGYITIPTTKGMKKPHPRFVHIPVTKGHKTTGINRGGQGAESFSEREKLVKIVAKVRAIQRQAFQALPKDRVWEVDPLDPRTIYLPKDYLKRYNFPKRYDCFMRVYMQISCT